jgi:hypothetical protein
VYVVHKAVGEANASDREYDYTAQFLVVVKNSSVVEAKPSSNALRRSTGLPNSVSFLITPFVSSASFVLEEGRPSTH